MSKWIVSAHNGTISYGPFDTLQEALDTIPRRTFPRHWYACELLSLEEADKEM